MLGPLNIGTLDVSKSWEVSVSWEVLQEEKKSYVYSRLRQRQKGKTWITAQLLAEHTILLPPNRGWTWTLHTYTVEKERNTVKTEKIHFNWKFKRNTTSFRPTVYYCSKDTSLWSKIYNFAIVELCVKHMIWHTCAITIKGTLEGFRQHFSRFALFRFCFSCCVFLQIIIESMCLPSVKVWKNS